MQGVGTDNGRKGITTGGRSGTTSDRRKALDGGMRQDGVRAYGGRSNQISNGVETNGGRLVDHGR